jgi:hypothetical protein
MPFATNDKIPMQAFSSDMAFSLSKAWIAETSPLRD